MFSFRSVFSILVFNSYILVGLLLITIFIVPFFPVEWHSILYRLFYSIIFFVSALSLKRARKLMLYAAMGSFSVMWLSDLLHLPLLESISQLVVVLFFIIIVLKLLIQIAGSKKVDSTVILDSISGYLLMGVLFTFLSVFINHMYPSAFYFPGEGNHNISDLMYFSFVTLTTLGYGDILPILPQARSLALLISVSGQLYLTIVIAVLVGKFLVLKTDSAN
ncbi:MAG: ion channel [Bacteroidota bacterium]|nr:ion channel [Bacteroidota bacterium]